MQFPPKTLCMKEMIQASSHENPQLYCQLPGDMFIRYAGDQSLNDESIFHR